MPSGRVVRAGSVPIPCQFANRHFRRARAGCTTEEAHSSRPIGADLHQQRATKTVTTTTVTRATMQARPAARGRRGRFRVQSPRRPVRVGALSTASVADSASPGVVVSQVYAGGGNAGAGFANDFVELFNRGSAAVDVGSWTVQYAPAAGTAWQATALSGSIAPGRFYLVSLASTAAVGAALPKPDASGTTNLAASGGKVALVRGAAALTCGAPRGAVRPTRSSPISSATGRRADFEGKAPAPGLDGTTAARSRRRWLHRHRLELGRLRGGCAGAAQLGLGRRASAPARRRQGDDGGKGVAVNLDVQPVLSISLDQSTLSFGKVAPGSKPAPLAEHVTVVSNDPAGYSLKVHRSAFAPGDLPLAISATAPGKATLGAGAGGRCARSDSRGPGGRPAARNGRGGGRRRGDVWPARLGFASALPAVARRAAHGHRHVHGDRPVRLRPPRLPPRRGGVLAFGPAPARSRPGAAARRRRRPGIAVGVAEPRPACGRRPQHAAGDELAAHGRSSSTAAPAGYALDLRGRPRIARDAVAGGSAPWLVVRPRQLHARAGRDRAAHRRHRAAEARLAGRSRGAHRPRDAPGRRRARRGRRCGWASSSTSGARRRRAAARRWASAGSARPGRPHARGRGGEPRQRVRAAQGRPRSTVTLRRRGRLLAVLRSQGQELLPQTTGHRRASLPRRGARPGHRGRRALARRRRAGRRGAGSRCACRGPLGPQRRPVPKRQARSNALPFAA